MNSYTFKACTRSADEEAVADFLFAIKDELLLPDEAAAWQVTELLFTHGGVMGGYHNGQLCAVLGYFKGDPKMNFENKEIAFMYVAGILPAYRLTRMFYKGLIYALHYFRAAGLREIRLQAEAVNPYTNKLYARFAKPIGKGKTLRGAPVNTYGGLIADALAYLERGKRPYTPPPQRLIIIPNAQHHNYGLLFN